VAVRPEPPVLHVDVREKWTLIPNLSLTTGKTARDLQLQVGLEEYNFLGSGTRAIFNLVREERGYGFQLSLYEHPYRLGRWSLHGEASYRAASYRFPSEGLSWLTWLGRMAIGIDSPPVGSPFVRYSTSLVVQYENVASAASTMPQRDELAVQVYSGVVYDRYRWHDLVPRGFSASAYLSAGASALKPRPRHGGSLEAKGALPLWPLAVLIARVRGSGITRGSPHAGALIGSIDGVRGLPDGLYRTWLLAYGNAELRQSVRLPLRLALQAALFADGACFAPMDARGQAARKLCAASFGVGFRGVPTFIANAVLRVDLARLIVPTRSWFVQLAFSQHFS
jgi:hypothetical protein